MMRVGKITDKREFPRVNCRVEATMISNGYFFRDMLLNLSEEGAQVEIKSPVRVGRDILLRVRLGSRILIALGDIQWKDCSARKMGVQFIYLPQSIKRQIRAMVGKPSL